MSENKDHHPPRSAKAMGQFSAAPENAEASTTIVGGQPAGRKTVQVQIPVGVERVLFLAASDEAFCQDLLTDRDAALDSCGLKLRDSERAMLRMTTDEQLQASINALDITPSAVQRRGFLKAVAVSAATLAAANALGGCGDDADVKVDTGPDMKAGIPPDAMPHDVPVSYPDAGVMTDGMPFDVPYSAPDSAGILPDTVSHDIPFSYKDGIMPAGIKPDK